jgi:two-component system cell cycle sensor histidine kinase/response regulator CckA
MIPCRPTDMAEQRDNEALGAQAQRLRERVAELERAEERLLESEERFRTLVEGSFEGLMVSVDGRIVETNSACAALAGLPREQMIGKTVLDFATPESASKILDSIRQGMEKPYEAEAMRADGSTFPCEILGRNILYQGRPARITGIRDLTERKRAENERKRLEEQMLHAQKLETLGVLAGGIAHDFNNLLLVVLGHAELALSGMPESSSVHDHLSQIRTAALRASELTTQMLSYAGRTQTEREPVELGDLVRDMSELLRVSVSKRARVVLELADGLPAIEADPGQLRQVLMNLITNASDALGEEQGEVRLRTGEVFLQGDELAKAALDATAGPGRYVFLEVQDDGCGMDRATVARIFDPFFSTKFAGRGLGLASLLGIVRAHAGAIEVHSELGRGTRFRLFFPASSQHARPSTPPPSGPSIPFVGRGVALLADDERMLRNVGAEILSSLGFEVLTAENGQQAVDIFRSRMRDIALVVLDATMPTMGGAEALRVIRELSPITPVIMVSGFQEVGSRPSADPQLAFLAKPFEISALVSTVKELLQRADGP